MQKLGAPMLEEEFYLELRVLARKGKFYLLPGGQIRCLMRIRATNSESSDGWLRYVCPVCAVFDHLFHGHLGLEFRLAGRLLGMPEPLYENVARAADNVKGHDATLRARMLEACGLV